MKVGFDAKRAFYNFRGLGSYSRSIIEGLCKYYSNNDYHCYSPKIKAPMALDVDSISATSHIEQHAFESLWRTVGITNNISRDGIQVYHGLSNELPRFSASSNTKTVVSIHDLTFRKYPEYYPVIDRQIYKTKVKHAIKHADLVIAISSNTKVDLAEYHNIDESQIRVIPSICDDHFFEKRIKSELEDLGTLLQLPKDFLLFVGPLTRNKNILSVIHAIESMPDKNLVIVGHGPLRRQLDEEISKKNLKKRVLFVSRVNQIQLSSLYQLAYATIIPSFYEGFALPIVESLASGTPVVCSNTSAMPETCGPTGITFDPNNPKELVDSILKLSNSEPHYNELVIGGYDHALKFKSENICQQLINAYSELI